MKKHLSKTFAVKRFLESLESATDLQIAMQFIDALNTRNLSDIKTKRRYEVFFDIMKSNGENHFALYDEYWNCKSRVRQLEIRHGKLISSAYSKNLSNKIKSNPRISSLTILYWTQKGYSEEEARLEISKKQRNSAIKRHKKEKENDTNYKIYNPLCIEYWLAREYLQIEAESMVSSVKNKTLCNLDWYIEKYGVDVGTVKFNLRQTQRLDTIYSKYGVYSVSSGRISKPSKHFFLKFYKQIRKLGISKEQINVGIGKNKEFVRTDLDRKRTYFYDFAIRNLKIIVEFNGSFWHPKTKETWRGLGGFDERMEYDKIKINFAESLGYDVLVIWDDENLDEQLERAVEYVRIKKARMD